MQQDPEILAMSNVLSAFQTLNNWQRKRIVDWVTARFKLDEPEKFDVEKEVAPIIVQAAPPVEIPAAAPAPAPVPVVAEAPPAPKPVAETPKNKNVTDYDTVLELFADANVKKVNAKILLMAAYLQEKLNYEEITSYDINSRLKRINHRVPNITSSINAILKKKPALIVVTGKGGENKQARRKFKLTEAGIELANSFLA